MPESINYTKIDTDRQNIQYRKHNYTHEQQSNVSKELLIMSEHSDN